jgi:hypothetical protein
MFYMKHKIFEVRTSITLILIIGIVTYASVLYLANAAAPSSIPATTTPPPYAMSYITPSLTANVTVPGIGNITSMIVFGAHYVETTYGINFDVLSLTLGSTMATGTAQAFISTGPAAWFSLIETVRNGTTYYQMANGTVTLNNFFQVGPNELSVKRNGTLLTVDFNPANNTDITLPSGSFPAANFSSIWTVPAFHFESNGTGNAIVGATSTTSYTNGWKQYSDSATYSKTATFNCPSWSNYNATTTGSISEFQVNRFVNPSPGPFPSGIANHTLDYYTGGSATVAIPTAGNITQMTLTPLHVMLSDHVGSQDLLLVNLTGPLATGNVTYRIDTNSANLPINASSNWIYALLNGTTTYTEVNGNPTINNILTLGTSQLNVSRSGTHVIVDFNPTSPVNITLDAATFPRTSFPSIWTLPAFNMDFVGYGNLTFVNSNSTTTSKWTINDYNTRSPANLTFTCPSWNNYTTNGISASLLTLFVESTQAPATPIPTPSPTPTPTSTPIPYTYPTPTPTPIVTQKPVTPTPTSTPIPNQTPTSTPTPATTAIPPPQQTAMSTEMAMVVATIVIIIVVAIAALLLWRRKR